MIRKALLYTTPLIFLLILLVLYQWSMYTYGPASTEESGDPPASSITITHSPSGTDIEQTIKGINEGTYILVVPNGAEEMECVYEEGESCLMEETSSSINVTVSSNKKLHFTYRISSGEAEQAFGSHWFMKIKQKDSYIPMNMKVSLAEKQPSHWTWFSPAKKEAVIKKSTIDYYKWEAQKTDHFPLYVIDTKGYVEQTRGSLTIYSNKKLSEQNLNNTEKLYRSLSDQPLILLVGRDVPDGSKGVLSIPSFSLENVEKAWYRMLVTSNYDIPDEERWLIESIVAYATSTEPDSEKGEKVKQALDAELSAEEKDAFLNSISKKRKGTLVANLDQSLSEVEGLETTFFQKNKEKEKPFVSLFYYETKPIVINGERNDVAWAPILMNNDRSFPLGGLAEVLHIDVTGIPGEGIYIVRKGEDTWRFTLGKQTFIENEESFGIASDVLFQLNGEVYIKERYMKEILGIHVQEDSNNLYIRN